MATPVRRMRMDTIKVVPGQEVDVPIWCSFQHGDGRGLVAILGGVYVLDDIFSIVGPGVVNGPDMNPQATNLAGQATKGRFAFLFNWTEPTDCREYKHMITLKIKINDNVPSGTTSLIFADREKGWLHAHGQGGCALNGGYTNQSIDGRLIVEGNVDKDSLWRATTEEGSEFDLPIEMTRNIVSIEINNKTIFVRGDSLT